MSDGSNNGDKDKTQWPVTTSTREQKVEDTKTLQAIMNLVRTKVQTSETIQKMIESGSYTTDPDYASERKVLYTLNNLGLTEGFIATMVTFVTLRNAPRFIVKYVMRRQGAKPQHHRPTSSSSSSSYRLDTPPNNPFQKAQASGGERFAAGGGGVRRSDTPFTFLLRFFRFGLDAFASLLVGASVSLYLTDQEEIFAQLSTVPLVEGKSIVADEFCTDIIKEFEKKPPEYWNQTSSPTLQYIRTFVKNCHLRQNYENKLRKDYGLPPDDSITIPSPGVDTSYSMAMNPYGDDTSNLDGYDGSGSNIDNTMGAGGEEEEFFTTNDSFNGTNNKYEDDEWAKALVTDQEDDSGNKNNTKNTGRRSW